MAAVAARQLPQSDTMPRAGFRSFWKRSSKTESTPPATFVSQDPSRKEDNRASRVLGSVSPSSDGRKESSVLSDAQKRRQQVYQAQKRHRNRKSEYISSLEAEIARLRHADAEVNVERETLSHQNQAMKEMLASRAHEVRPKPVDLSSLTSTSDISGGSVNRRFDEQTESDRWFVDFVGYESSQWTSSEASGSRSEEQSAKTPLAGDSCAALDFILALEYPCRDHVHHPLINPEAWKPDEGFGHGHAMTTTAAVFAGAQPSVGGSGLGLKQEDGFVLPHAEIDKLVDLSQKLAFDDTDLTPAQAYAAVRESVPSDAYLRPVLGMLKQPLAKLVHCAHFGSVMDSLQFWEHFDASVQSLQFTRPDLGQRRKLDWT